MAWIVVKRKAYQAMAQILQTPEAAVRWLTRNISPAPIPDPKLIGQWIEDLDSPKFAVRSRAEKELAKLGKTAESGLRRALKPMDLRFEV